MSDFFPGSEMSTIFRYWNVCGAQWSVRAPHELPGASLRPSLISIESSRSRSGHIPYSPKKWVMRWVVQVYHCPCCVQAFIWHALGSKPGGCIVQVPLTKHTGSSPSVIYAFVRGDQKEQLHLCFKMRDVELEGSYQSIGSGATRQLILRRGRYLEHPLPPT